MQQNLTGMQRAIEFWDELTNVRPSNRFNQSMFDS